MRVHTPAGEGMRVLLLEPRAGCLGGMQTGGLAWTDIGVSTAVIGGRSRSFYEAVARYYNGSAASGPMWHFEPKVAALIYAQMLNESVPRVDVREGGDAARIVALAGNGGGGGRIASASLADGSALAARVFIDATYEGALLPLANVSFAYGREATSEFGELVAGVLPEPHPAWERDHPFTSQGQPWINVSGLNANGALLPGVSPAPGPVGSADDAVQSYGWRVTFTFNASNMLRPWPRPESYNASLYALQLAVIRQRNLTSFASVLGLSSAAGNTLPGNSSKTDFNNHYLSQPYLARPYPPAVARSDWPAQQAVWDAHRSWQQGLFYFLATDAAVPQSIRDSAGDFGLPLDEHVACGHFPCQLYVREALRMQGAYVMTETDIVGDVAQPDSVGRGAYTIDTMHASCFPAPADPLGSVLCEGGMQSPSWLNKTLVPFQIPLRALTPRAAECTNLLVPVALSSTHVGFNAVRLEPTWQTVGESAGVAAAFAVAGDVDVQAISVPALQARLWALGQVL